MRKVLFGLVVGVAVLAIPAQAFAEAEGPAGAAKQIEEVAKEHNLDTKVVECLKNAAENNDTKRCIEAPSPITPAKNEMIYGGLSFLVLLVLLWKFALPAVTGMMNARSERIRQSIDDAERAKTEAETLRGDYERQLADARAEANRLVEEARVQADQTKRDLVAKAEAEANEVRQRNAEQVVAERDRVMGELQGQVAALAIELAEKVVEHNLDREANTRLIENYISTVGTR